MSAAVHQPAHHSRQQMADCSHRMNENHTRAAVPHHLAYLSPVRRSITMYLTPVAARLALTLMAIVKAPACILQQSLAVRAQTSTVSMMMVPAIQGYHVTYRSLLSFNTIHIYINVLSQRTSASERYIRRRALRKLRYISDETATGPLSVYIPAWCREHHIPHDGSGSIR